MERIIERVIFGTRWLLVPLYLGMAASMAVFVVKFYQELFHLLTGVITSTETEWLLGILALIDNVLVANLVVMVLISGYETFVSPIDFKENIDKPGWLGKMDTGTIKVKLASAIVGISLIKLLATYLNVGPSSGSEVYWKLFLHLAFVVTALFLAFIDLIVDKKKGH